MWSNIAYESDESAENDRYVLAGELPTEIGLALSNATSRISTPSVVVPALIDAASDVFSAFWL